MLMLAIVENMSQVHVNFQYLIEGILFLYAYIKKIYISFFPLYLFLIAAACLYIAAPFVVIGIHIVMTPVVMPYNLSCFLVFMQMCHGKTLLMRMQLGVEMPREHTHFS